MFLFYLWEIWFEWVEVFIVLGEMVVMVFLGIVLGFIIVFLVLFFGVKNIIWIFWLCYSVWCGYDIICVFEIFIFVFIFICVFGLGFLVGVLVIVVFEIGIFGKLFFEVLENMFKCFVEGVVVLGGLWF